MKKIMSKERPHKVKVPENQKMDEESLCSKTNFKLIYN